MQPMGNEKPGPPQFSGRPTSSPFPAVPQTTTPFISSGPVVGTDAPGYRAFQPSKFNGSFAPPPQVPYASTVSSQRFPTQQFPSSGQAAPPTHGHLWFTLKEGSHYNLKFSFRVSNNIVAGLKYNNTVWKTGVKVDSTKEMLGTFSPQEESYTHEMPEETTPSGIFARGQYSARTKFLDDDNKCYLEINYTFDIRRDWPST